MAEIGETELDLRVLSAALWRRAWLLAGLAVAAAIGTYVALGFVDPLYTADTRILIEERESPLTRPREDAAAPAADFDESAIQSQVEVLRSREIADAVIDKLDLMRRPEFDPARQPSLIRSLLVMVGIGSPPTDSTIRQRVMESYFDSLSVYPLQKSRVIGVEFSASDPELAAEVANAVADAFVALQQDAKRQSAIAATDWLQQEIERLRARVAEAEQAVADYRESHGLFEVDQSASTPGGNLSTQQLGDINAELARARAARAEAQARADLVQRLLDEGGALDASEEVLNSQLIQRLRERQGALRAQIAELSTTLLPTHPRIRALEGQVENLEMQIRDEARKVLASLQTAARVAAAREESLLRSLNDAKADVSRTNEQDIELRALEREAAAQRDLLESFLGRYREAAARTDANYLPADARIISRAVAPETPSFPKKTMMSIAAAVAMFLIAAAVVLLQEFLSGRAFRVIGAGVAEMGFLAAASEAPPKPLRPASGTDGEPDEGGSADGRAEEAPHSEPEAAHMHEPAERPAGRDAGAWRWAEPQTGNMARIFEVEEPKTAAEPDEVVVAAYEDAPAAEPEPAPAEDAGEETVAEPEEAVVEESDARTAAAGAEASAVADAPAPAEPLQETVTAAAETEQGAAAVAAPPEAAEEPRAAAEEPQAEAAETEKSGAAALADIVLDANVGLALFAGAEGGEGAGGIAFTAAREAAKEKLRCLVIDMGRTPSQALGNQRPGLCDLLAGDASFGEVIQRDERAQVHVIPYGGSLGKRPPLQRMRLVLGALTHTYDKVIVVSDRLKEWPHESVKPDVAAIVCAPETTESLRTELYDFALAQGAKSAIIIRYTSDLDLGREESAAA